MLEDYLLDHKWLLVIAILAVAGTNVLLASKGRKWIASQDFVDREGYLPPGLGGRIAKSPIRHGLSSMAFVALLSGISLFLDRNSLGTIAGGLLVAQTATAFLSLNALLSSRALLTPGSAEGKLTYSAAFHYLLSANQFLECALIVWFAFLLRGGSMLLGGGIFLSALAAGLFRRSRQAQHKSLNADPEKRQESN